MRHLLFRLAEIARRFVGVQRRVSGTRARRDEYADLEPWELPGWHYRRRDWEMDEIVKRFDVLDDEEAAERFYQMHRRSFTDNGSVCEAAMGHGQSMLNRTQYLSDGARRLLVQKCLDHILIQLRGSQYR